MTTVIPPADNLFRGAHHPLAFQKTVFRLAKFMKLYWDATNPRLIEASFVWDRYTPTQALVHAYGCRVSSRRNRKPGKRDVYCGAYHLKAIDVRGLATTVGLPEVATADIVHQIEDNEIAHVGCIITLRAAPDGEGVEGIKTIIVDRLWNACRGPLTHTCQSDRDLDPHPSDNLEAPPLGQSLDDRTIIQRAWCLARYWLLMLAWKARSGTADGR